MTFSLICTQCSRSLYRFHMSTNHTQVRLTFETQQSALAAFKKGMMPPLLEDSPPRQLSGDRTQNAGEGEAKAKDLEDAKVRWDGDRRSKETAPAPRGKKLQYPPVALELALFLKVCMRLGGWDLERASKAGRQREGKKCKENGGN